MVDIEQDFPIRALPGRVFAAVSRPPLLDQWWPVRSRGEPRVGAAYELDFGPGYFWRAVVTVCRPDEAFALRITEADADWRNTVVGFELAPSEGGTEVRFYHRGWPEPNAHYRTSCHCWAMYLRVLRRHLEHGETVPYDERLRV